MSKTSQHKEWMKLKDAMMNRHSKKLNAILDSLPEEEFVVAFFKLLEYVQPKLQRQEVELDTAEDLEITVKYVKSDADESKEKETSIIDRSSTDNDSDYRDMEGRP